MGEGENLPVIAKKPCDEYGGKMAGNFPCVNCGWLWSEHPEARTVTDDDDEEEDE